MNTAFDLDGTLVSFGNGPIEVNKDLIDQVIHHGDVVHIVTNQGGIPLGLRSPENLAERLAAAWQAIEARGATPGTILACVYHDKADLSTCILAKALVRYALIEQGIPSTEFSLFAHGEYRKPSGNMLRLLKHPHHPEDSVVLFFGDSDDDEGEAAAAGVPFTRVSRFTGG